MQSLWCETGSPEDIFLVRKNCVSSQIPNPLQITNYLKKWKILWSVIGIHRLQTTAYLWLYLYGTVHKNHLWIYLSWKSCAGKCAAKICTLEWKKDATRLWCSRVPAEVELTSFHLKIPQNQQLLKGKLFSEPLCTCICIMPVSLYACLFATAAYVHSVHCISVDLLQIARLPPTASHPLYFLRVTWGALM